MPFVQLNFSTHESAIHFQQSVNQALRRLYLPIRPLNVLLDLSVRDWSGLKTCRRVGYSIHVGLVFLGLLLLLSCMIVEPYSIFSIDSSQPFLWILYAAYCVKVQGFVSLIIILLWNLKQKRHVFQTILMETSSGAGCLRKAAKIRTLNYFFLFYNLLRLLLIVGVAFLRKFNRSRDLYIDEEFPFEWRFVVSNIFTSISLGLCHLVGLSLILSFSTLMSSEFDALADDFKCDSNTFQLPVLVHYAFAYKNLMRLFKCLKGFLSVWVNFQLCFGFFQLFYILSTVNPFDDWIINLLNFLFFADSIMMIATNCLLIVGVNRALENLCGSMVSLSVSGKVLNEGTFPLINAFAEYMRVKRNRFQFLCGIFEINARSVIRFSFLVIFLALWSRFSVMGDD